MNITEEQVEKCLDFLRDTAEEYAAWKSAEKYYTNKIKSVEATKFLEQSTGAVESRRLHARASDEYKQCLEDLREASYNAELLEARRSAAELKISYWQSAVKANRAGY